MSQHRTTQEQTLFQSVQDYYATPSSLDYYSNQTRRRGLWGPEQAMVDRFMTAPGSVLDIGCGAGRESFELARMGFCVHGIDVTRPLLEEARRIARDLALDVTFTQGDGSSLEFPDESFDYVLFFGQMIHHVPGRKNRIRLLTEAGRVVKSQGTILLTYHDWDIQKDHAPWGWQDGHHCREPQPGELPQTHVALEPGDYFSRDCSGTLTDTFGFFHRFTQDEIEGEVVEAGLLIVDWASFATIGEEVDDFWKPTRVLVLHPQ